jgi:hypothetical protein
MQNDQNFVTNLVKILNETIQSKVNILEAPNFDLTSTLIHTVLQNVFGQVQYRSYLDLLMRVESFVCKNTEVKNSFNDKI